MRWSIKIASVFGIPIKLHITFLLLLLFVAFTPDTMGGYGGWVGVVIVLAIFASVVLHELSHSFVARKYGINVREIILLPIGGVANIERMPEDPKMEIAVAVAGPAMSILLALLFRLISPEIRTNPRFIGGSFFYELAYVNFLLALFNLIPALPMDGGRILRGYLTMKVGLVKATKLAVTVGQGFAVLFFFIGIFYNWILALIAVFIFLGAEGEEKAVVMRRALQGVPTHAAMLIDVKAISPDVTLRDVISFMCHGLQEDFPLVRQGKLAGMLTRKSIYRAIKEGHMDRPVETLADHIEVPAYPEEPLEDVFRRMQEMGVMSLPVVQDERIIGIVTVEQIARFTMLCPEEEKDRRIDR